MSVVLLGSTSGSVTLQEPAIAGSTVIDLPATSGTMAVLPTATSVLPQASGGTGTTTGYYGFKNRIINGAMVIDQRNVVTTVNSSIVNYSLDRWRVDGQSADGVFTVQKSTTAPAGFTNSLLATVTTADTTIVSTQLYLLSQAIEGFNIADFGFGAAGSQTVTLSFWVRSSVTGTFGGTLTNGAVNYSYPFTFAISSANTFEYKTITVAGATAGTWLTDNGAGLRVWFSLGAGSTYLGTSGSWAATGYYGATGQTNLIATSGATFYITGVQLEKGSTATSFDYRPYGTELQLCQRYYESTDTFVSGGIANTTGTQQVFVPFRTTKSGTPTCNFKGVSGGTIANAGLDGFTITRTNDNPYTTGFTAAAEL
jgi:hypothetical protein